MNVLIVEDDDFKFKNVSLEIRSLVANINMERAASVREAVYFVQNHSFDLIILDMSLPSHRILPGKGPAASLLTGGMEIVYELAYMERHDPIVILTQYPELD
jgi:CheY-like chemotaxis protein